jgi:hypothetical protein
VETIKRASDVKGGYRPTVQEQAAIDSYTRRRASHTAPKMKVVKNGAGITLVPDHLERTVGVQLISEAIASNGFYFYHGLTQELANVAAKDQQIDEAKLNYMLSLVEGVKPRDQVESMLAAQMAAIHTAMMKCASELDQARDLLQKEFIGRALNKLARTFAAQMESLKHYRTGGEQKVTVQHVWVSEGGQAIVGNVTQSARGAPERPANVVPSVSEVAQPTTPIVEERDRGLIELRRRKIDGGRSAS